MMLLDEICTMSVYKPVIVHYDKKSSDKYARKLQRGLSIGIWCSAVAAVLVILGH